MFSLGGHIGPAVSSLVDGQLDAESSERAWAHILTCPQCRRLVEREGWVKTQLASMAGSEPPTRLVGSLYDLHDLDDPDENGEPARTPVRPSVRPSVSLSWDAIEAWVAVEEIEQRGKGRRRAGLAMVGAGSVSVAVLGFASLSGAGLGIGGAPAGTPTTSFTRSTTPASPTSSHTAPTHTRPPYSVVPPGQREIFHVTNR